MTYASYSGLPDPDYQGEFYADVPIKRGIAWVIDKSRPFVRCDSYFGPDRRRHDDPKYTGPERRAGQRAKP